ncbi:MAG TPA: hypothetical protein DCZ94_03225 [Lentisphaeria bacterium]|nr:MAG: hypothetical protein A2X48_03385 [Lentisphaerae bacterium GWF2_49_21]HBC85946.1 hypothetical protein [Lentisphaeria bacterium]
MKITFLLEGLAIMGIISSGFADDQASNVELAGDWKITVSVPGKGLKADFTINPTDPVKVLNEKYPTLPDFNPKAWGGWQKGIALKGVKAQECTVKNALDPKSLKITQGDSGESFAKGTDFDADLDWGGVGRLTAGKIKAGVPVLLTYEYTPQRIDSVVMDAAGKSFSLKPGTPHVSLPKPPELVSGETRIANIYLPAGKTEKLTTANIFPVLEQEFPAELSAKFAGAAEKLLPKTLKTLKAGGNLKILAWGDSVTDGGFLPDKDKDRWQCQFVSRLKQKFPNAKIELVTEAWGGHNTTQYLAEPPGSVHNYKEKVLAVKPDLVVIEFVNDAGLKTVQVNERYSKLLADFKELGTEVILQTPHYVRPDWMGLSSQRDIDNDPREYSKALREFAAKNNVALADAAERYGRLWRQGIPYLTLMSNNINHPCPEGMKLFADSLMSLFE